MPKATRSVPASRTCRSWGRSVGARGFSVSACRSTCTLCSCGCFSHRSRSGTTRMTRPSSVVPRRSARAGCQACSASTGGRNSKDTIGTSITTTLTDRDLSPLGHRHLRLARAPRGQPHFVAHARRRGAEELDDLGIGGNDRDRRGAAGRHVQRDRLVHHGVDFRRLHAEHARRHGPALDAEGHGLFQALVADAQRARAFRPAHQIALVQGREGRGIGLQSQLRRAAQRMGHAVRVDAWTSIRPLCPTANRAGSSATRNDWNSAGTTSRRASLPHSVGLRVHRQRIPRDDLGRAGTEGLDEALRVAGQASNRGSAASHQSTCVVRSTDMPFA